MKKRDYELVEAYAKLAKDEGTDVVEHYQRNTSRLVNGEAVTMNCRPVKERKKFLGLF